MASDNDLLRIVDIAARDKPSGFNYAGEVSPKEAFEFISENKSMLVDVRTVPEWQFVGTPKIPEKFCRLLAISWKIYPSFIENPDFIASLSTEIGGDKDMPIFFICRSGGRSLDAAVAATAVGYKYCFNVTGGFEGDVNGSGHRSSVAGWKFSNLPWVQG